MGNEGQNICGDLPETTAFKSYAAKQERRSQYANYSDLPAVSFLRLTHSEASEGYPTIVNNIQPCPKLCLLMPLAYVGARTDSTSYTATREAWPISAHAHWRSRQDMLYLRRGFSTLVLLVPSVTVVESLVQVTVVAGPPVEIQVRVSRSESNVTSPDIEMSPTNQIGQP